MSNGTIAGAVFVQTNEVENKVVAFRGAADGTLAQTGVHSTEGAGAASPISPRRVR